eukprot:TRINITY_DN3580_c0_g1_i22.p2 TRINITY_DN3580_c0_g1~~TRINITY_DN3580_c0_g1_i22.p2  ORF type:complete len:108 (+),score=42.79 TRINITY_DN3580_c0_g1_i22:97-420(+)
MEEKKCVNERKQRKESKDIKLHCPGHAGDPKIDHVMSSFYNKLLNMNYTELSALPMFKNIKDIHEEAFAEAKKMSCLKHGNYFGISGLTFFINYHTEVIYWMTHSLA